MSNLHKTGWHISSDHGAVTVYKQEHIAPMKMLLSQLAGGIEEDYKVTEVDCILSMTPAAYRTGQYGNEFRDSAHTVLYQLPLGVLDKFQKSLLEPGALPD